VVSGWRRGGAWWRRGEERAAWCSGGEERAHGRPREAPDLLYHVESSGTHTTP
jgi:hypothetical protein